MIAFAGNDPQTYFRDGIHRVDVDANPPTEQLLVPRAEGLFISPNRLFFAFVTGDRYDLVVSAADGSQQRILFPRAAPVGWLSDSSRLIFSATDSGNGNARLYSISPDGSGLSEYASTVHGSPSPDGALFAYQSVMSNGEAQIHLISAAGTNDRTIARDGYGDRPLVWSPDGSRLAFWRRNDLAVAQLDGEVRGFDVVTGQFGGIVWSPDGNTIYAGTYAGTEQEVVAIDLASGTTRLVPGLTKLGLEAGFYFSPDGTRIAFGAGGECRDRVGWYVADADGTDARRVSTSCRIVGTDGADILHGSYSQIVIGNAGNDTLYADDTNGLDGNTLLGGPGNDRLVGGVGLDTLYGGPGNDNLSGGGSADSLVGGPGHDHIDGGRGNDTIHAQDGQRDWINCGRGRHDNVFADRVDVIAKDCELVHRR